MSIKILDSELNRLLRNVNIDPFSGCWITRRKANVSGLVPYKGTNLPRVIFQLFHNVKLASNVFVIHTCDKPKCINPEHLKCGSHRVNMDDMVNKERMFCKVTPEQREEIKTLYATGNYTLRQLGWRYKVDASAISRIINDKTSGVARLR